jgi:hypothetical protein
MDLKIGDLVQCRDNHYNRGLEIVGKIGMVAELRRKDARILFDVENQSMWLAKNGLNRIVLPPTDNPDLLDRLTWLIHFVDASECELDRTDQGDYRYLVVCGSLSLVEMHTVRDYLGALLVDMKIVPRGMSRLGLEVVFKRTANESGPR